MPRCSVLCYYFNEEKYLRPMIQSVLDQSFTDFEFVLLDNGSTDGSRAIAHSFDDPRIRHLDFDEPVSGPDFDFGLENTVGFKACQGDLIAVAGGDDLMMPDRLARQVACFDQDSLLDVCHSGAMHIDANASVMPSHFRANPYHEWSLLRTMFTYCEVAYPTAMIRRSSWEKVGFFGGGYAPDYWLWLEIARKWRFRYLPEQLMYYRVHASSASHSPEGMPRCIEASVKIRTEARARYSIEDFFPEIALCPDKTLATAAAYLELGNMMLGGGLADIQLAFNEYKKADELLPDHPAIVYNAAMVLALDGQNEKALEAFEILPDSPHKSAGKLIARGIVRRPFEPRSGREICPDLYRVTLPPGLWKSDGTLTGDLVHA